MQTRFSSKLSPHKWHMCTDCNTIIGPAPCWSACEPTCTIAGPGTDRPRWSAAILNVISSAGVCQVIKSAVRKMSRLFLVISSPCNAFFLFKRENKSLCSYFVTSLMSGGNPKLANQWNNDSIKNTVIDALSWTLYPLGQTWLKRQRRGDVDTPARFVIGMRPGMEDGTLWW